MPPVAWCTLHHVLCVSRCRALHPLRRTLYACGAGALCAVRGVCCELLTRLVAAHGNIVASLHRRNASIGVR
jgi:hypothetical protein